jgi:uncharacterized coiled-coil protein SlyX
MGSGFVAGLPVFLEVILGAGLLCGAIWAIIRLGRSVIEFIRGDQSKNCKRLDALEANVAKINDHLHELDVDFAGHNITDLKERISKLEEKIDKLTSLLIEQQMMLRSRSFPKVTGKSNDSNK